MDAFYCNYFIIATIKSLPSMRCSRGMVGESPISAAVVNWVSAIIA